MMQKSKVNNTSQLYELRKSTGMFAILISRNGHILCRALCIGICTVGNNLKINTTLVINDLSQIKTRNAQQEVGLLREGNIKYN